MEAPESDFTPPRPRWIATAVLAAVVAAAGLRLGAAVVRSLWLDEFHSLHHALADGPGALLAGLRVDNHPPTSFLLLQAWAEVAGSGQVALRLPAVLYGALGAWLAARLAGHLAGRASAAGPVAGLVAACSGLAVLLGAEIRMYALLALCVVGTLEAVAQWCARQERDAGAHLPWRAAVFIALGLTSHYWFLHHLGLVSLVALGAAALRSGPRWTARDVAPLALGVALALPWFATGFRDQLTGHDLWPGGSGAGLGDLAQSYLLLLFFNLGTLPTLAKLCFAAAGAGLLAAALLGAARGVTQLRGPRRTALLAVAATALLLGPWGALVAQLLPRAGFNWNYLAGAIPALAVLIGLGVVQLPSRWRWPLAGPLLGLLAAGGLTQAVSSGTEDLRGAVEHVLAEAERGDAVLSVEWQPPFFPHGQAWTYYGAGEAPWLTRLEHTEHYGLEPLPSPPPARVHVIRRGLPLDAPLLLELRQRYRREDAAAFGYGVSVQTFAELR